MRQCVGRRIQRGENHEWKRTTAGMDTDKIVELKSSHSVSCRLKSKKEWGHGEWQRGTNNWRRKTRFSKRVKWLTWKVPPCCQEVAEPGSPSSYQLRDERPGVTDHHPPLWSCTCHSRQKVASNSSSVARISWRIQQLGLHWECLPLCESSAFSVYIV